MVRGEGSCLQDCQNPNHMCFRRLTSALKLYLQVSWKVAWCSQGDYYITKPAIQKSTWVFRLQQMFWTIWKNNPMCKAREMLQWHRHASWSFFHSLWTNPISGVGSYTLKAREDGEEFLQASLGVQCTLKGLLGCILREHSGGMVSATWKRPRTHYSFR